MPLYLYCFVTGGEPAPAGVVGLAGAAVRAQPLDTIVAWVSEAAGDAPARTPEHAREHDAVVRAAMAHGTPLPARFGQLFAGEDALRDAVAPRAATLAASLARVQGQVEMTVRLVAAGGELEAGREPVLRAAERGSGRAYLQRARARVAREEAWRSRAAFLQDRVAVLAAGIATAEARADPLPRAAVVSHLVPRGAVDAYRAAVATLTSEASDVRVMVTGPWAPYSFASDV